MRSWKRMYNNKKKIYIYFSSKGFPIARAWTFDGCKKALEYAIKHGSIVACLHIIRLYWEYKWLENEEHNDCNRLQEHNATLIDEYKRHKTVAVNVQRTCEDFRDLNNCEQK